MITITLSFFELALLIFSLLAAIVILIRYADKKTDITVIKPRQQRTKFIVRNWCTAHNDWYWAIPTWPHKVCSRCHGKQKGDRHD